MRRTCIKTVRLASRKDTEDPVSRRDANLDVCASSAQPLGLLHLAGTPLSYRRSMALWAEQQRERMKGDTWVGQFSFL